MIKTAYLACSATLPGAPNRRTDAYEHDFQIAALRPEFLSRNLSLTELDWRTPGCAWSEFDAVIIGTTWDYTSHSDEFLTTLETIEASGTRLFNPVSLVRWNSRKTYLRDLTRKGVPTLATLWKSHPAANDLAAAFDDLETDVLVVKRQIGAGAHGQIRIRRGELLSDYPYDAMIQPFLPTIETEGEVSFVLIDGAFSHAVLKRARAGDYRIQSQYGGWEESYTPSAEDLSTAVSVVSTLEITPLYARVDMVRGGDGKFLLMELELIEPYLYPVQSDDLGAMMADALQRRLSSGSML